MQARVLYATITGNNEAVADIIIERLRAAGWSVTKEDIINVSALDIDPRETDLLVVVPYTFDQGTLPDEALDFYEDLLDVDFSSLVFGVAGSGDTFYGENFATAVDKFEERLKKSGAKQGAAGIKVNLWPDTATRHKLELFTDELIIAVS